MKVVSVKIQSAAFLAQNAFPNIADFAQQSMLITRDISGRNPGLLRSSQNQSLTLAKRNMTPGC